MLQSDGSDHLLLYACDNKSHKAIGGVSGTLVFSVDSRPRRFALYVTRRGYLDERGTASLLSDYSLIGKYAWEGCGRIRSDWSIEPDGSENPSRLLQR